jgi:hypothetical protein
MNVKPGDMAKVLGLPENGGGAICEVLAPASAEEIFAIGSVCGHRSTLMSGPWWSVRVFSGARSCNPFDDGARCYLLPGDLGVARDALLRRIDPMADDTVDEVPVAAEVTA